MPAVALAKMAAALIGFSTENSDVATPRANDKVGRGPRVGMGGVYRLEVRIPAVAFGPTQLLPLSEEARSAEPKVKPIGAAPWGRPESSTSNLQPPASSLPPLPWPHARPRCPERAAQAAPGLDALAVLRPEAAPPGLGGSLADGGAGPTRGPGDGHTGDRLLHRAGRGHFRRAGARRGDGGSLRHRRPGLPARA